MICNLLPEIRHLIYRKCGRVGRTMLFLASTLTQEQILSSNYTICNKHDLMHKAVTGSYLNIIRWGVQHHCILDVKVTKCAAITGDVEVMKYLLSIKDNTSYRWNGVCPIDKECILYAISVNHLDMMKYLSFQPFEEYYINTSIRTGDVQLVQYLLGKYHTPINSNHIVIAASTGKLDMLTLLHRIMMTSYWKHLDIVYNALKSGSMDCVNFLLANGALFPHQPWISTVRGKNLEMIK